MVNHDLKIKFTEFLKSRSIAVISTVSESGQPMAATIYFTSDEHFNVYFMTKNFSRKYKNLETNQLVALVIGAENEPVTAQIQGKAEKIIDAEKFRKRLDELEKILFKNKYVAPLFQLAPPEKNEVVIYKITPTWIRWLDLRDPNIDGDFIQILE